MGWESSSSTTPGPTDPPIARLSIRVVVGVAPTPELNQMKSSESKSHRETVDWDKARKEYKLQAGFFPWSDMKDGDVLKVTLREDLAKPKRSSYYIYEAAADMQLIQSNGTDRPPEWVAGTTVLFGVSDEGKMAQLAQVAPNAGDSFLVSYRDRRWTIAPMGDDDGAGA